MQPEHLAARKCINHITPVYSDSVSEPPYRRLDTGAGLRTGAAVEVLLMRRKTSQEPTRSMGT